VVLGQSAFFLEVSRAVRIKRGVAFEELCNDYLKARFPQLTPCTSMSSEWTAAGTPDAFGLDSDGLLIACQYGGTLSWRSKLFGTAARPGDAAKVAKVAAANELSISKFIYCTTAELDLAERLKAERDITQQFGFQIEICDLVRLSDDITRLYPGIAVRRLGIPIPTRYFVTLHDVLPRYHTEFRGEHMPFLYFPDDTVMWATERLEARAVCLLIGNAGSGKSTTALALALKWSGTATPRHPESLVHFVDAVPGQTEQVGRDWYSEIWERDYQSSLFVIDDCHLAPTAVNALLYQWSLRPPTHSRLLCIGRFERTASARSEDATALVDWFERKNAALEIRAEESYLGVIRSYGAALKEMKAANVDDVEHDLVSTERRETIQELCSHNLAVTRAVLDAWASSGGRVSDVTEDAALALLARSHLTPLKSQALVPLVALAQYEIRAHDAFTEGLPPASIEALRQEELLVVEDSAAYGRSHRITLHPVVAHQLFRSYVRQRVGADFESRVRDELFGWLQSYVASSPENVIEVYTGLSKAGESALHERLLAAVGSQTATLRVLTARPVTELCQYLRHQQREDVSRARELLGRAFADLSPEQATDKFRGLQLHEFLSLSVIDAGFADSLLASSDDLQLRVSSWTVVARRLADLRRQGYGDAFRVSVIRNIDTEPLIATFPEVKLQRLNWALRELRADPPTRDALLARITADAIAIRLGSASNLRNVVTFLDITSKSFAAEIVSVLDVDRLIKLLPSSSLQTMCWLIRHLQRAPHAQTRFFANLPLEAFARRLANEGTALHLRRLQETAPRSYMQRLTKELGATGLHTIIARSRLGTVGNLYEYSSRTYSGPISQFIANDLLTRIADEPLEEIGKFSTRVSRVSRDGQRLAAQVFTALLEAPRDWETTILSHFEEFAVTVLAARSADEELAHALAERLLMNRRLEHVMGMQDCRSLQLLIRVVGEAAPESRPRVATCLQQIDLHATIAAGNVKDIAHLTWNAYHYLDVESASTCALLADVALSGDALALSDPEDLARLLWNIVQVADSDELRLVRRPDIRERVSAGWTRDAGSWIGVAAHLVPPLDLDLSPRAVREVTARLGASVDRSRPHVFAIAMNALRLMDTATASRVQREVFRTRSVGDWLRILSAAHDHAETEAAQRLLLRTRSRFTDES
jgi:hypothetical protein